MQKHLVIEKPDSFICAMTYDNRITIIKVFTKHFTEWVVKQDALICENVPEPEQLMLENLLESRII